jgi:hypothetical protein
LIPAIISLFSAKKQAAPTAHNIAKSPPARLTLSSGIDNEAPLRRLLAGNPKSLARDHKTMHFARL